MTSDNEAKTPYQVIAEIIYAEHPDRKASLNNGAQLAIESIRSAITSELSPQDMESILGIIAAIAAELLTTSVNNISEKINLIFDIHSLAAGSVIGEIDLGDVSAAKDMVTLMKEAREQAESHTEDVWDNQAGPYL